MEEGVSPDMPSWHKGCCPNTRRHGCVLIWDEPAPAVTAFSVMCYVLYFKSTHKFFEVGVVRNQSRVDGLLVLWICLCFTNLSCGHVKCEVPQNSVSSGLLGVLLEWTSRRIES